MTTDRRPPYRPQDTRSHDRLTLAAVPEAVAAARDFVRLALRKWQPLSAEDDALLVASELVTNAVTATRRAGPGSEGPALIAVRLTTLRDSLVIGVRDASDHAPAPRTPDAGDENGRGLLLVRLLARDWGVHRETGGGKTVWAKLMIGPEAQSPAHPTANSTTSRTAPTIAGIRTS
ncbi:ATP-binding protein [Streptomyces sp. J2-1]|uniref:ATP-binding protein n=1 Tax=Streptomyces corallincola TaxID=2851888 RepID=UPI001C381817|nr:ATP-binding protein [Streptomyces corallincola]MBV2355926.1 ATP-binding protein [Streptomyces corallincola]